MIINVLRESEGGGRLNFTHFKSPLPGLIPQLTGACKPVRAHGLRHIS